MFSASYQRYSWGDLVCGHTGTANSSTQKAIHRFRRFNLCNLRIALPERLKTFTQRALTAGKHRRVAKRVRAGFRFSELLDQVEEVRGEIRFKRHHELLIVETKRICRVQFH